MSQLDLADAPSDLASRWQDFRAANPKVRIRDAAASLGASEGALVATGCGTTATRLRPEFAAVLAAVPALGQVMALTRNDACVHERHGRYLDVSVNGGMGLVLGPDIDLRLFLTRWAHGFAVDEAGRRSLQFFDASGDAIHKVYITDKSDAAAYDDLVARFASTDQSSGFAAKPRESVAAPRPDDAIDAAAMRADWLALRDTHDFFALLRRHGAARTQALRLAGPGLARPLNISAGCTALEAAAASGVEIMLFVGNKGCIQIHTGPVKSLKVAGPWINVLDPDFNLHLREAAIVSAWLVRKPTDDGIVTSLELFGADGEMIAQLFGARKPGKPELPAWRELAAQLERDLGL